MSTQVLFGAGQFTGNAIHRQFIGSTAPAVGAAFISQPMPIAGSFSNLRIELSVAHGNGTLTFTVHKNDVATAMTVTFNSTDTVKTYTGTPITYAATDTIRLTQTLTGFPNATIYRTAVDFTPTVDGEQLYGWGGGLNPEMGAAGLGLLANGTRGFAATFMSTGLFGAAGTMTIHRVRIDAAPGSGKSRVFTLVKNGVDQNGSGGTPDTRVTIADLNTVAQATFSLTLAAGDTLACKQALVSSPAAITYSCGIAGFTPTVTGTFVTSMSSTGAATNGTTEYNYPNGDALDWATTITEFCGPLTPVFVNAILVQIAAAPGAAKSWTWTLQKNQIDTTVTVTISGGTDTLGSATFTPPIEITSADRWGLKVVAAGSPNATGANQRVTLAFSAVEPDEPIVETRSASGVRHDRATLRGRIDPNLYDIDGRFAWSTDPDALSNETTPVSIGDGDVFVSYSTLITGLTPNTTYYFRAIGNDGVDDFLGEILSFRTLGEQLFVDGEVSHPLTMLSFIDRDETRHVSAEVDLNDAEDYEGGYKEPTVLQWLPITRGASGRTGQIEHMAYGAVLSDTSRFFRALLDDPTNRFLTNRPLWELMIDDEDRRLEGLWRFVANGYVSDYEPRSSLQFVLNGCDWLKKKFSRKAKAQRAWQPTITIEDFPTCPPETLGLAAPLPYGKVDDSDVQTTEVGTTLPYDATLPTVNTVGCRDRAAPPGTLFGSVTVIVCVTDGVSEGPISNAAGTNHYSPHSVQVGWDQVPGGGYTYRIYAFNGKWLDWTPQGGKRAGSPVTWVRLLTHDNTTMDGWSSKEMAVQFDTDADGSDALTGVTTISVDQGHGDLKPIYVGLTTVDGLPHHTGLISRGVCKQINELYIDGIAQNIATDASQSGVGGIWKIPGYAGWSDLFADPYTELNDRRYTLIYGLAGQLGPDRMAGVISESTTPGTEPSPMQVGVTLNVWGFEDVGDASGELITSLAQQHKHFARNFMASDTVPEGDWLATCPEFPHIPGLTLVDEASFDVVEAITQEIVPGSPGGFEGGFIIGANGEAVDALSALAEFCVNGDWSDTFTRKGQYTVFIEPKTVPDDLITVDDIVNIVDQSFSIRDQVASEFFNILPYVHTKDYTGRTTSGWFSTEAGDVDVRDATSITNYDQERESPTFELTMLRSRSAGGAATIVAVMARKLARYRHPLRTAACTIPLSGTQIEVGDLFRMSHIEGIGASGWVGRLVLATRHELDANACRTKLDVYDVEPLLELPS